MCHDRKNQPDQGRGRRVSKYIAFKRKLGMRLCSEAGVLRAFCRTMGDIDIAGAKPDAVRAFIAGNGPVTRSWKQGASVLHSFYRYPVTATATVSQPSSALVPSFHRTKREPGVRIAT